MREGVRYTRERLTEAASQCAGISEVIEFFEMQPNEKLRRYLLRRFAHYGIDISHFPHRRRGKQPPRPTAGELRHAVSRSTSISGALRLLDRTDSGQMRELFRRWTAEDGLATAHFLGQAHQRGRPRPTKPAAEILVQHDGERRTRTHLLRRALREVGEPEECAECGIGPVWLGESITLEIDHVNGDWSDDRRENLRLLCPNCHAITSTWCRGGQRVQ
ncbi:HNH endonuclease signature motif containing protein [Streptomyces sp. NPDC056049]|uniref:HNH endonuclease signature motif containing protein n=1 Tax=Streptomyces sp. NPDC056049 TaxID=3345693 RepID=UPI0035D7264A